MSPAVETADACAMLLTPPGRGAVATILVQGAGAPQKLARCFLAANGQKFDEQPINRVVYGRWMAADGEEIVACRVSKDEVELHCHGGHAAAAHILADLADAGVASTTWQEDWQYEHADSIRAEALAALSATTTVRTATILWDQYSGALERSLVELRDGLESNAGDAARRLVRVLLDRAAIGRHLIIPYRVAIVGRPNVGKSSLLNALVGYGRAIVHDAPGTTRDLVTAVTAFDGWPCELIDTAGLRATEEPIEQAGIELAGTARREADLVIWVRDATQADDEPAPDFPGAPLAVWNKADLLAEDSLPSDGLRVSALTGTGLEALMKKIAELLVSIELPRCAGVPFTAAQIARLERLDELLGEEQREAAQRVLGEWLAGQCDDALPGEIRGTS